MKQRSLGIDPRFFQVIFQLIFLAYGIFFLHWQADWRHYTLSIGGCLFFNYAAESIKQKKILPLTGKTGWRLWGFSVLISAMSLCLLLKTNFWTISLLAAFLTVASKYILRFKGRHLFNPSALGIIATILITKQAWLSPGQWGSNAIIFFGVLTLGTIVVTRVQKLDISLAFLLTYCGLLYWRQVYILGWPTDYFIHSVTTGSLLLFTFFMISDPKTSPDHPVARIIWAVLIAAASFYLAAFKWKYNTPVWVLVAAAPLVPLLNMIFRGKKFYWKNTSIHFNFFIKLKHLIMKTQFKKGAALLVLTAMVSHEAMAFCGFYVSKADGTLKNKTSQVILVRDGEHTAITMYNDFKGNTKDFAMVVPVPVLLQKNDIKVVDQAIFNTLNDYSQPRLVEYYDENPCNMLMDEDKLSAKSYAPVMSNRGQGYSEERKDLGVHVEAKYLVGEYDIMILSAKESTGLRTWLDENGYKIPKGADEVLEPYIKSNLKFFVAKVNEEEKKKMPGNFLRPLQISFNSPKFMLPIRLGMANADGDQDLIVYAFSKKGRVECTNYRTMSLPTGNKVPLFVKNNFGSFYSNLFQHQWEKEGESAVWLEYAWDVSPSSYYHCDPCIATAPSAQDLVQSGVWWINRNGDSYNDGQNDYSDKTYFTRLHIRYNRHAFPQDLMFQVTPNAETYQARYVITHPATGDFTCEAGRKYLKELKHRRADELENLSWLTGKDISDWHIVSNMPEEKYLPKADSYAAVSPMVNGKKDNSGEIMLATIGLVGLLSLAGLKRNNA